jgi:hypothetical protein
MTIVGRPGDDGPLTIWVSRDGRSWERVHQDPYRWGVRDVAWARSRGMGSVTVVAGEVMVDPRNEDFANGAIISTGRAEWVRSIGWMTPPNSYVEVAAVAGRTAVVLGSSDGGGEPLGWWTRLPP